MSPTPFAIAGAGWRAEFYLRIAQALPERFRVTGVLTRDPARAARVAGEWATPTRSSLDELLADPEDLARGQLLLVFDRLPACEQVTIALPHHRGQWGSQQFIVRASNDRFDGQVDP